MYNTILCNIIIDIDVIMFAVYLNKYIVMYVYNDAGTDNYYM